MNYSLSYIVQTFNLDVNISEEEEEVDPGRKSLIQRCTKLQKLLILFLFCSGLQQKPPDYDTVTAASNGDFEVRMKLSSYIL